MDSMNLGDVCGSPMELLLESDEEEASLLEEMEQQKTVKALQPSVAMYSEASEMTPFGGLQQKEDSELLKEYDSSQLHMKGDASNLAGNSQCIESVKDIIERLHSKNIVKEEPPDAELEDKLVGIQILHMDIAECDLIAAKSAVALQLQMEAAVSQDASFTPHFLSQAGLPEGLVLGEHAIFSQDIIGFPDTNVNGKKRRIPRKKRKADVKSSGAIHLQKSISEAALPHKIKKIPRINLPPEDINNQGCVEQEDGEWDATNGTATGIQGYSGVMPTAENSRSPEVNFCCHFCRMKYPLTEENIPNIIRHMNPPERYNHLFKTPERLSCFKENIKLSVLIAKDKSKAQVRLVSRVECSFCNQQFTHNIENSEHIVIHSQWCHRSEPDDSKTIFCLFCNETVPKTWIRKHLQLKSRKRCKKVDILTLQLMSSVCEDYARQHKPLCIVCNEKEWPFRGHRGDLEPVCEACRLNITSGNTTKLVLRDVTGCAICGLHCADKYVTYWASEMESLFIGESCIKKLKNPKPKSSEEAVSLKAEKLKNLVVTALSSVTVEGSSESNQKIARLAPGIINKYGEKCDSNLGQTQVGSSKNKRVTSNGLNNTKVDSTKNKTVTSIGLINTKVDSTKNKTVTGNGLISNLLCADTLGQQKVLRGKFVPLSRSFKIVNSNMSLPFSNLTPTSLLTDCKEEKMDAENTSPLMNITSDASLVVSKQLEKQMDMDKTEERIFSLPSEQMGSRAEGCKTRNKVLKLQKVHVTRDGMTTKPLITYSRKRAINNLQQAPLHNGKLILKVYTEEGSKSDRNSLPMLVSNKESAIGTPVTKELCVYDTESRDLNNITESQECKYVIKYVPTSENKPSDETQNIADKTHIVIKTFSGMPLTSSTEKSPRLAEVIKTDKIVCEDVWDENKLSVGKRHRRKQLLSNTKPSEIVTLD